MPKNIPSAHPFILAAAALSGALLAVHIYLHLGDYTAERGVVALLEIAAVSSAFGALVLLVLGTLGDALERIFPKD